MLQSRLLKLIATSVLGSAVAMCSSLPAYSISPTSNIKTDKFNNTVKERNNKIAAVVGKQNGFVYDFGGCRRVKDAWGNIQIDCVFKITYVGRDASSHLYITGSRIFSATDGNQYDSSGMTVAGRSSVDMIRNQPIRAVVSFPYTPGLKISTLEFETNQTNFPIRIGRKRYSYSN